VGVGDSLEASYALKGPIPSGRWHLVGDGGVLGGGAAQVDVTWEIRWRPAAAADAGSDQLLATFQHHFVRAPDHPFDAIAFEADADGAAAAAVQPGDQLVLRVTATAGDPGVDFVPNGDGAAAKGRDPRIDLPTGAE
jgi:hypothetical protein